MASLFSYYCHDTTAVAVCDPLNMFKVLRKWQYSVSFQFHLVKAYNKDQCNVEIEVNIFIMIEAMHNLETYFKEAYSFLDL